MGVFRRVIYVWVAWPLCCVCYMCALAGEDIQTEKQTAEKKERLCGSEWEREEEEFSTKWRLEALRYHITK